MNEETAERTKKRSAAAGRTAKRLLKLTNEAIDCLEEIITDSGAKPGDRIAAAKLAFEAARSAADQEPVSDGIVRVIFDGCPVEYGD